MVIKLKETYNILVDPRLLKVRQRDRYPEISAGAKKRAENSPTFINMDPSVHGHQRFIARLNSYCEGFNKHTVRRYLERLIKTKADQQSIIYNLLANNSSYLSLLFRKYLKYFDHLLDERIANPGDNIISSLAKEQLQQGNLER
ncbi:hypothetical protein ASPNIDRAFT_141514 [Aspergillus niger ATCC 1015]|uniref:Uncharacterized protein n=1 Tax=Aspergillus niger (strain ATCC 1015 / CBS 113.46 / FGSC A1144 / LSHB Ac4 / NCTC 3858a / NRRL 328 / USDA 3528.7) TaxID=380704 RepID=G3XLZ0_ASPNA|nr:hypothetical protein ASPNIDRAFT_141514 [Aspergillus niger ATCC 1015]